MVVGYDYIPCTQDSFSSLALSFSLQWKLFTCQPEPLMDSVSISPTNTCLIASRVLCLAHCYIWYSEESLMAAHSQSFSLLYHCSSTPLNDCVYQSALLYFLVHNCVTTNQLTFYLSHLGPLYATVYDVCPELYYYCHH